jgi:hypothetical protein
MNLRSLVAVPAAILGVSIGAFAAHAQTPLTLPTPMASTLSAPSGAMTGTPVATESRSVSNSTEAPAPTLDGKMTVRALSAVPTR